MIARRKKGIHGFKFLLGHIKSCLAPFPSLSCIFHFTMLQKLVPYGYFAKISFRVMRRLPDISHQCEIDKQVALKFNNKC